MISAMNSLHPAAALAVICTLAAGPVEAQCRGGAPLNTTRQRALQTPLAFQAQMNALPTNLLQAQMSGFQPNGLLAQQYLAQAQLNALQQYAFQAQLLALQQQAALQAQLLGQTPSTVASNPAAGTQLP